MKVSLNLVSAEPLGDAAEAWLGQAMAKVIKNSAHFGVCSYGKVESYDNLPCTNPKSSSNNLPGSSPLNR